VPNVVAIKYNQSISLVHVIGKLFSKVLANQLAPLLGELVHASQTMFIKGHFIQDNFKFVQAVAKLLHSRKQPYLLLKVDIVQGFDSVT
jgi:hypothetical protein